VYPTVSTILGLPGPELPGVPLLSPTERLEERAIYSETFFGRDQYGFRELRSAIAGGLHYIEAPRPELYDLIQDPLETHNLISEQRDTTALKRAIAAVGSGTRFLKPVSREEEERLAALGYIGGPSDSERGSDLPDAKDHIRDVTELWRLVDQIGKTDSLAPEMRVRQLLSDLGLQREDLSRTVARNLLRGGHSGTVYELLEPFEDSPDPETQIVLGEAATALGRLSEARARFERALAANPRNPQACRDLGILFLAEGRLALAVSWLERALELDADQAEAWNALGVIRARNNDPSAAIVAWREAVGVDPALSDAWFNLALTLDQIGDPTSAAEALEQYIPLVTGRERARAEAILERLRRGS
jgi:Flp pilus assembly protein TadD